MKRLSTRQKYGRTFAIPDTIETLLKRARKGEDSPEDHTWETTLYYRGVIDRHDTGMRRTLSSTEAKYKDCYDRGWVEMGKLMGDK